MLPLERVQIFCSSCVSTNMSPLGRLHVALRALRGDRRPASWLTPCAPSAPRASLALRSVVRTSPRSFSVLPGRVPPSLLSPRPLPCRPAGLHRPCSGDARPGHQLLPHSDVPAGALGVVTVVLPAGLHAGASSERALALSFPCLALKTVHIDEYDISFSGSGTLLINSVHHLSA